MMEPEVRIIQSATDLFYRYGIKSITMDDMARHLAMSKKTLYQHFRDKNDLVLACCSHDLLNRECDFKNISENATDAISELIGLMKHMESMFSSMNPNLFFDLQKYHPTAWNLFKEFKNDHIRLMIESNLERGEKEGLYRKDIDIKVIAKLRLEEVEMGFNPEIFPPGKFHVAKVQMALFDHFMHGITTLKGHKLINKYKQISEEE